MIGSRWRFPTQFPWLSMPQGRMGPPLRSFARCALLHHGTGRKRPTEYKDVVRCYRARQRAPLDPVIPTATSVPSGSELSRPGPAGALKSATLTAPARAGVQCAWVGAKKRASRSNKETGQKKMDPCRAVLTRKTPYKESAGSRAAGSAGAMGNWLALSVQRGAGEAGIDAAHERRWADRPPDQHRYDEPEDVGGPFPRDRCALRPSSVVAGHRPAAQSNGNVG